MSKINNIIDSYKISLFEEKKLLNSISLSTSFGCFCQKLEFNNNHKFIVKGTLHEKNYDSIFYEGKNLKYLNNQFPKLFPKVLYIKKNIIVMEFIENNNVKNNLSEKNFLKKIIEIHKIKNKFYGFKFDTPIGGLRQPSKFSSSWVEFYEKNRLGMIYELINLNSPMPRKINLGIENILKNLKNLIPANPKPSLIHGDLWEGNILYDNGKLVGLIDPSSYFAHNEMEISYLKWFNYISNEFYEEYSNIIKINKDFYKYSEVYELYYALLNVHLWSRDYINNVAELVNKYN